MTPQDYDNYDPDAFENENCFDDEFMASYSKPMLKRTKKEYVAGNQKKCQWCGCFMSASERFCWNCNPQN
jgi:hypothetical protein